MSVTRDDPASTRIYDSPPWMPPLLVKAALPAIPGLAKLPGLRRRTTIAPDLALVRQGVRVDPGHLARYVDVCDFALADTLPATYPHIEAFALHLALMTDRDFPFPPIGTVHAANTIRQVRPMRVDETFDLTVYAADLRPHPKGRLIDIVTAATVDGEIVWQETTTVLRRGRRDPDVADTLPLRDVDAPIGPGRWLLPGGLGRRYAGVSGDHNPIHLYAVTAKAFGFSRQIVHGMWTKARCLAALQPHLPDAYAVTVAFRRPIMLPGSVRFGIDDSDSRIAFGVTGGRDAAPHLVGIVTPDDSIR
ncbi:MAG TPA: MaoC/PaaZ C-terminal domain-containing protein [Nocardioidaceae bacterium]|nr:MaoC/PaaZ C-terminal domain-containing protein [Nocardioidaceae bacterium]